MQHPLHALIVMIATTVAAAQIVTQVVKLSKNIIFLRSTVVFINPVQHIHLTQKLDCCDYL